MESKKTVRVFISYAHEDKPYYELLTKGIKKHAKHLATIQWETWDDTMIIPGELWHNTIQEQIHACNFAILLVSCNFLYSDYIHKEEFSAFLKRQGHEQFLFFPILIGPCDIHQWPELGQRQFFKPTGKRYGQPDTEDFSYSDLGIPQKSEGINILDPNRERYHMDLVKALEAAIVKYAATPEKPKPRAEYFKVVKSTATLEPLDIFVSPKRARTNEDFYWLRETDTQILDTLQRNESLLILGNSLAGKTRALYEALKKLENTTVLVPTDKPNTTVPFTLPERNAGQLVAVFDDIDQYLINYEKEKLEELIFQLLKNNVVIAATCRRGDEYLSFANTTSDKLRGEFEVITIGKMNEANVKAFKKYICEDVSINRKVKLDTNAFDHNIGSYFMELTNMSDRYTNLELKIKLYSLNVPENVPREILKALKYFYYTENMVGKSRFDMNKIKDFCERSLLDKSSKPRRSREGAGWGGQLDQFHSQIEKKKFSPGEWKNALKILSDSQYELNFIELREPHILVEEVYLERVVEKDMLLERILNILEDVFPGEDLREYGFMTTIFAFTRLLNNANTLKDGFKVLDKIKGLGLKPNKVTFTTLINKANTFEEAIPLLDAMKDEGLIPDEVTFTSLINRTENVVDALPLLDTMKQEGLAPDAVTFNSLINRANTFEEALPLLDIMRREGLTPNKITFTTLIKKANTFEEAFPLLESMKQEGLTPDEVTFTSLINKSNTFDEALPLLESMKQEGLTPDTVTFNSLINKANTFEEALHLLNSMKKEALKPNKITFNSLINKANTYEEALHLMNSMKKEGLKPDKITVFTLIKIARQKPIEAVKTLFSTYPADILFTDITLSRTIATMCKQESSCLDYIIPYIPALCNREDTTLREYARLFEYSGAAHHALTILECMKIKDADYYNIKANCLKNTDPSQALELYTRALNETNKVKTKVYILNNIAKLIYEQKMTGQYGMAMDYCRQALNLIPYIKFKYPGELLLLFKIDESSPEQVIDTIKSLISEFKMNKKVVKDILDRIINQEKKDIIKTA